MKVTIRCGKCGWTFGPEITEVNRDYHVPDCPNCSKLTFGPLTEEIVMDALYTCWVGHEPPSGGINRADAEHNYRPQARFVLRLLELARGGGMALNYDSDSIFLESSRMAWRQRLLDLAHQAL